MVAYSLDRASCFHARPRDFSLAYCIADYIMMEMK